MNCHDLPALTAEESFFLDYQLSSVFQPVFSLGHRRTVGFESLIRGRHCFTHEPVSPATLFNAASNVDKVCELDARCQKLHLNTFANKAPPDRWLFLNIDSSTLKHESYHDDRLVREMAEANLPFERLVIEVLESSLANEGSLLDAVEYFRSKGALIALDDFGAGHSNFDRIWRLGPDIIKLDRSIIFEADRHSSGNFRRMLPDLVALMHDAGSLVLVEGIETEAQATIALDADADFAQGFYLAKPSSGFDIPADAGSKLDRVTRRFAWSETSRHQSEQEFLAPYIKAFRSVRSKFKSSSTLRKSCGQLLAMPGVLRCSLFNEQGEPIIQLLSLSGVEQCSTRFRPVLDGQGGTWFRRRYFRDAINRPRRIQISRPYLSSTEGCVCITMSVSNASAPRRVFCCKIKWES